jgi:hypothetical protein
MLAQPAACMPKYTGFFFDMLIGFCLPLEPKCMHVPRKMAFLRMRVQTGFMT